MQNWRATDRYKGLNDEHDQIMEFAVQFSVLVRFNVITVVSKLARRHSYISPNKSEILVYGLDILLTIP